MKAPAAAAALLVVGLVAWLWLAGRDAGVTVSYSKGVRVLSDEDLAEALGPLEGLSPDLRATLAQDDGAREPLPRPVPGDWLTVHEEPGQTLAQFLKSRPNAPSGERRVLYVQPLENARRGLPSLAEIPPFLEAFFGGPARVLPPLHLQDLSIREREGPEGRQLLGDDLLSHLRERLPADGFALLGLTPDDLYADGGFNFVYGLASLRERVGVFSLARLSGAGTSPQRTRLRATKVLAHEMGHMFGMEHCIFHACLMNGSNHVVELDSSPLHLCAVCLRKLHASVAFDVVSRYRALEQVCREAGFADEAAWISRRLAKLGEGAAVRPGRGAEGRRPR